MADAEKGGEYKQAHVDFKAGTRAYQIPNVHRLSSGPPAYGIPRGYPLPLRADDVLNAVNGFIEQAKDQGGRIVSVFAVPIIATEYPDGVKVTGIFGVVEKGVFELPASTTNPKTP